jgi:hypothetical protein
MTKIHSNGKALKMTGLLLCFLLCSNVMAGRADTLRHRQNIAFGISRMDKDSVRVHNMNIGLFANVEKLKGVQFGLFTSNVYKDADGVNMGGLLSATGKRMRGIQMAGISNLNFHDMHGLQLSTVLNAAKKLEGFQISGFNNVADEARAIQLCGISNICVVMPRGAQISSLLNLCATNMHGAQLGSFNYVDTLSGSQIGIINICSHHKRGVQIGIFNFSRDTVAHKIGLVNINPKTRIQLLIYGGSSTKINFAARFRNRSTYNILGVGTQYMGLDKKFSGALFYRIGEYFNIAPKISISGDVGYYHIETFQQNSDSAPERLFSLQGRINLDYRISNKFGVFTSVGYGKTMYYSHCKEYKSKMILELGFTLF